MSNFSLTAENSSIFQKVKKKAKIPKNIENSSIPMIMTISRLPYFR